MIRLELMAFLRTVLGESQNFGTVFLHQDGMFELCGKFSVTRSNGPAILTIEHGIAPSEIEHRFDRQTSTGMNDIPARFRMRKMWNARILMEFPSYSVPLILSVATLE